MEIDPRTYPSRAFIRFLAQNQIRADLTGQSFTTQVKRVDGETYVRQIEPSNPDEPISATLEDWALDKRLFEDIAKTAFSPNRYPELYQSCTTAKAAKAVESRIAADLVQSYLQIKLKQKCPIVERLNALL